MAEADEEEDAAEQQCVLLRTEQIAGEKKSKQPRLSVYGETETAEEEKRKKTRIRWLEYHNFPRDGALV
jgi:hypothetical protein